MKWLRPLTALGIVVPLGCADGTLLASRPHDDPSSPGGPEAKIPPPPSLGARPAAAEPPEGAVVYTCVMHPQIIRDTPGACPICGMALAPKHPDTP